MTQLGSIRQLNVSNGGVPKRPVPEASVHLHGMEGDAHVSASHQGPDRALCLYSVEVIEALREDGHDVALGSTGENITVSGLDLSQTKAGQVFTIGDGVTMELIGYCDACGKMDAIRLGLQDELDGKRGMLAKVVNGGQIKVGDSVRVEE